MSSLRRRITPTLTAVLTHPATREARRSVAEARRRLRGGAHVIQLFHQVDDPYSQLLAQTLTPLVARYDVTLEPHLVGPPPDAAAPERERLEAYSRRDAADIAPFHGLHFAQGASAPPSERTTRAGALLAGALENGRFAELAPRVGDALWGADDDALASLAKEFAPVGPDALRAALSQGTELRERLGHYLGGMLYYGGEWYWGIDRLQHLERRLDALGLRRAGSDAGFIAPRPDPSTEGPIACDERLTLEFFPSLRSPYTAISMQRVLAMPGRLPVELVLRPVLPMVMRGLPVPQAKQMYILLDTRREAEDAGVAFGRMCDPVGRPIERAFSLFAFARKEGRAGAFLHSFTQAAFEEGRDTGSDAGLRSVVERAGLPWSAATRHLDRDGWQAELEENRRVMFEAGLWGVPSFRLLDGDGRPVLSTWGQDRIWLVESEIRRRIGPA